MKVIIYILFICLSMNLYSQNYKIYDTKSSKFINLNELVNNTSIYQIILFGEFHGDSIIHSIEYEYFKEFHQKNSNVALALEMFERDVQDVVNEYLASAISEDEFLKRSKPWPNYKKDYAPILNYAKNEQLEVIASNIPRKFASQYIQRGFTSFNDLPPHERDYIVKDFILRTENKYMFKFFETMLGSKDEIYKLNPNQKNILYLYYASQCLKDGTMAESIINFLNRKPNYKVIHYNGDFHSNSFMGIYEQLVDMNIELQDKICIITPSYYEVGKEIIVNDSLKQHGNFILFIPHKKEETNNPPMSNNHFGENYIINHNLNINIIPEKEYIETEDEVTFRNPIIKTASINYLKDLDIEILDINQDYLKYRIEKLDNNFNRIIFDNISIENRFYNSEIGVNEIFKIKFKLKGRIYNPPNETNLIQRHSNSIGIISGVKGEGIYLPGSAYYPKTEKDLANFQAVISIPKKFKIVTSFIENEIEEQNKNIYFVKSSFPIDDLTLVGGEYDIIEKIYDNFTVRIYSSEKNQQNINYLDRVKSYYDKYTNLFGEYPFKYFYIVENFFATGFGMPAYTLISKKLLNMPWVFTSAGSLAHEFVHNWWGNSVFVYYEKGNWCEALTTFSTNYFLNILEDKYNEALEWRKKALVEISSLPDDRRYPVKEFKYQNDIYDATIGYQKGAFIFIEIMKLLGEASFFESLKDFAQKNKGQRAYWSNLINEFDKKAKEKGIALPIRKIINNLISSKELPYIQIKSVQKFKDSLIIEISSTKPITSYLTIKIKADNSEFYEKVLITDTTNKVQIKYYENISEIILDPDYEILRNVYDWEKPYNLSRTINSDPIIILPDSSSKDYKLSIEFINLLKESGYNLRIYNQNQLNDDIIKYNSIIALGSSLNNSIIKENLYQINKYAEINNKSIKINQTDNNIENFIGLFNVDHPTNKSKLMTIIYFDNLSDSKDFKRLFHYMSYSYVLIDKNKIGKPILQGEILPSGYPKSELIYKF